MTASRRRKPQFEAMESILLLSMARPGLGHPDTRQAPSAAHHERSLSLAGDLQGAMQPISTFGENGLAFYSLNGSGEVGAVGDVTVSASVSYSPTSGNASGGTIKLTDGKGTIKLTLLGPPWDGTLPAPSFSYRVSSGTGHYRGAQGSGTAVITLVPQTSGYDGLAGVSAPGGTGTFTVQLNPA
jgi:hypothetical protein